MTSKAERKRKADASPVEFCRRSLAGGNVCNSLADLLKIMKLRGVGADDVKEVREIVQALIITIRKKTKRTEELEKAGYRSPLWAVLRALQQINSATRKSLSEQEKKSWLEDSSTMHDWVV